MMSRSYEKNSSVPHHFCFPLIWVSGIAGTKMERDVFLYRYPGTSYLATIMLSLRDRTRRIHPVRRGYLNPLIPLNPLSPTEVFRSLVA
jgi:hypothetical protein